MTEPPAIPPESPSALPFEQRLAMMRQKDPEAATLLFDRYARAVPARTRRHLDRRLAAKLDPEAVIQSVFRTLCRRLHEGEFALIDWDSLWGLLTRITLRRRLLWRDYYDARQRDVLRERTVAGDPAGGGNPSGPLAMREALERALRGLDDCEGSIVLPRLEGYGQVEIAARVGRNQAKASRVLSLVGERLRRMHQGE